MRPQVLLVILAVLAILATLPLGKGERFFPPTFQNLLLARTHGLARSTGCRRERGGRKSGAGGGHEREGVAVLRQVRPVPADVPAEVHLPGRFGARVPLGVQELRQVHRGQRQHQASTTRLPVRGHAHQLLPAPLHACSRCRCVAWDVVICCLILSHRL
jgi:hypothetical protein